MRAMAASTSSMGVISPRRTRPAWAVASMPAISMGKRVLLVGQIGRPLPGQHGAADRQAEHAERDGTQSSHGKSVTSPLHFTTPAFFGG